VRITSTWTSRRPVVDWQLLQAPTGVRVRMLVTTWYLAGRAISPRCPGQSPRRGSRIFQSFSPQGRVERRNTCPHGIGNAPDAQQVVHGRRQATSAAGISATNIRADRTSRSRTWTSLRRARWQGTFRPPSTGTGTANWHIPVSILSTSLYPEDIAQKQQQLNEFVAAQADSV